MISKILIVIIIIFFLVKKYLKNKDSSGNIKKIIHNTTKYNELSKQEENPIKALILSSYSIGYLKSIKDNDLDKKISGFNSLQSDVIETHNNIVENVFKSVGAGN